MKKVFVKVTSLFLGLTLAAGAVAIFSSKKAQSVNASEAVAASCDFTTKSASCTGYSKEHTYGDYLVYGGQNNGGSWNYFKFGGKRSTDETYKVTEAYIEGKSSISEDITKIEVVLLASTVNSNITWSVDYADNASFTGATNIDKGTLTHKVAGSYYAQPALGTFGSNMYYRVNFHIENTTTTNGSLWISKVNFIYESSVARGEAYIDGLDSSLLFVGGSKTLSCGWDPLDSGASISSYSFSSNDTSVLSVTGNTITAVAPGSAKITLNATDSNSETYEVVSGDIFVSKSYDFDVDDQVVLHSSGALMELTSINTSGTNYGIGTAYVDTPNGTLLWTVEDGNTSGSLSFVNDGNYLAWSSGNSLTTKTTKDDNSSWYVVCHDDYTIIANAATKSREIWWNSGTPRFACYEGKTPETSGYNSVDLMKIEEVPVRGTFAITSPTETLMRNGATGSLTYSWVPAEESSATIETIVWESSATDVISVSESSYEAIGPGKAKISATATDSNGQVYTDSTSDITVVDVVSGDYVKRTSVYDGDTVALVCEDAGTELSNVKSNIGEYVFYETKPASVFDFTLVLSGDYYYFKTSSEKYLTWGDSGKPDIKLLDEPTDKSLWSISFDENDNAVIENKELDGETHRYLAWNASSPRFAAYKTGQTAIQLYGPDTDIEVSYYGMQFINNLRGYTCDATGKTAPSSSTWENLNIIYDRTGISEIPAEDKELFRTITAVEHENPQTNRAKVEAAMAKYDYVVAKYNKTLGLVDEYPDFIGRDPAPLKSAQINNNQNNNINISVLAVVIVAVTSVSAIGVLLIVKKRKNHI